MAARSVTLSSDFARQLADPALIKRLAADTGINYETLRRYRSGRAAREDYVYKIAEALGVSPGEIAPELAEPTTSGQTQPDGEQGAQTTDGLTLVQLAEQSGWEAKLELENHGNAAAGFRSEVINEDSATYREDGFVQLPYIRVVGNSMAPFALDGQRILFDPKARVINGAPVLLRLRNGQVLCKRYHEDKGRGLAILTNINVQEDPRNVDLDDIAEVYKVAGVLIS